MIPDVELARQARHGDGRAFAQLARRHDPTLRAVVYKLLAGDRERTEQVLFGVYVHAFDEVTTLAFGADVGRWFYRLAYNATIDELRRVAPPHSGPSSLDEPDRDPIIIALRSMPVSQRVTLVLVDGEGFDLERASKVLRVGPERITARLDKAHAVLRAHLADGDHRAALAAIAVPTDDEAFWDRLVGSLPTLLIASPPRPSTPAPEPADPPVPVAPVAPAASAAPAAPAPPDGDRLPASRTERRLERTQRRRKMSAVGVAVAVTVVGAVVATAIATSDDGGQLAFATTTTPAPTTTAPAPSTAPPPPTTAPITPPATIPANSPIAVARRFVEALGAADLGRAKSFLGARSLEYMNVGVDGALRDAQDIVGPWTRAPDVRYGSVELGPSDAIVIVTGTRPDGPDRIEAIPARRNEAGVWVVEPWGLDPRTPGKVEMTSPSSSAGRPATLRRGTSITVSVPADGAVFVALGSSPASALVSVRTGSTRSAAYTVPGDAPLGPATVVIALTSDRSIAAAALAVVIQ